jgi:hypothetical protein
VLSPKDAAAPTLEQARQAGLLPVYADCEAYLSHLRQSANARNPASGRLLRSHEVRCRDLAGRLPVPAGTLPVPPVPVRRRRKPQHRLPR